MNPTSGAVAAIRGYVASMSGGWSNDDAAIVAAMNAPATANPAPRGVVPGGFQAVNVGALVSSGTLAAILHVPAFEMTIRPLLDGADPKPSGTIARLNEWAAQLAKAGLIQQAEFDALAAPTPGTSPGVPVGLFNVVVPDPSWAPQISWSTANLGRAADASDVVISRNT